MHDIQIAFLFFCSSVVLLFGKFFQRSQSAGTQQCPKKASRSVFLRNFSVEDSYRFPFLFSPLRAPHPRASVKSILSGALTLFVIWLPFHHLECVAFFLFLSFHLIFPFFFHDPAPSRFAYLNHTAAVLICSQSAFAENANSN